jgi:SAM-dependent methyltransferase
MRNLSAFADGSFDMIFHPVSNLFCPEIRPVWRECHRVLRPGGMLLAGFMNPDEFIWDFQLKDDLGVLKARYSLPFADADLDPAEREAIFGADSPYEYSHTMDDQIGGQIDAGFVITGFDSAPHHASVTVKFGIPGYFATRALKP